MTMKAVAVVPFVAMMVGCGQAAWYGAQGMPARQAQDVLASETSSTPLMGHIDASMQPVNGRADATSQIAGKTITYLGVRDGNVCFSFPASEQFYRTEGPLEQQVAAREANAKKLRWRFEARASFDDLTGKEWQMKPKPETQVTSAHAHDADVKTLTHRAQNGVDTWTSDKLTMTMDFCGPQLSLAPPMQYLVATYYPDGSMSEAPSMYIWKLDAAPTAP